MEDDEDETRVGESFFNADPMEQTFIDSSSLSSIRDKVLADRLAKPESTQPQPILQALSQVGEGTRTNTDVSSVSKEITKNESAPIAPPNPLGVFMGQSEATRPGQGNFVHRGGDALKVHEDEVDLVSFQQVSYQTLGMIAAGSMGEVEEAKDLQLRRRVAFKKLRKQLANQPGLVKRFLREAQITAQLEHPAIVPVYSLEHTSENVPAYTMKFVRGKTFEKLISETISEYQSDGELPDEYSLNTRLEHFLKVCDAMSYAHSKGVIHRDLKPANIMTGSYREVYVMDWGVAKLMEDFIRDQNLSDPVELTENLIMSESSRYDDDEFGSDELESTRVGQLLGTPGYMSPEQAVGDHSKLGPWSDLYALGLILFELVYLKPGFQAINKAQLLIRIVEGEKEQAVHRFNDSVPAGLAAIIDKATAREPKDRFQSVEVMVDELRRFLRGDALLVRPENVLQRSFRWLSKHRFSTLVLFMTILMTLGLLVAWSFQESQELLVRAREKERKRNQFWMRFTRHAQRINNHFLKFEGMLKGLAATTEQTLDYGKNYKEPFFQSVDYKQAKKRPVDLKFSRVYRTKVSVNWPVWMLKAEPPPKRKRRRRRRSRKKVPIEVQRLLPLRHYLKRMFLQSRTMSSRRSFRKNRDSLLLKKGAPISWAYIGLEKGITALYPGRGGLPNNFEPRKHRWYIQSSRKTGISWGSPYVDVLGTGLILPCSTAIYDANNQFLGVVGLELTFKYVIDHLLFLPGAFAKQKSYLLDSKARVMVRSVDRKKTFGKGKSSGHKVLESKVFHLSKVVKEIKNKRSGFIEAKINGRPSLVFFQRLNALGWYYAFELDASKLYGEIE